MIRANVQITELLGLTVMLMMIVALIAGQSGASAHELVDTAEDAAMAAPAGITVDQLRFDLDGRFDDDALNISFAVVTELSHFRSEDE